MPGPSSIRTSFDVRSRRRVHPVTLKLECSVNVRIDAGIMGAVTSDVHTVELIDGDGARRWREKC